MRIAAILALLFSAPAFAEFRCPARGGRPWSEYRSAHFVVDTDASARDADSLVKRLEHVRALMLQALVGEQVEIPGHVRVLAFSDQTDFLELAGDDVGGYYGRGAFGEPTMVLSVRSLWSDPETLAHELAHHLSFYLFPVQPHWFTEGLAEWVETVAAPRRETAFSPTGSHLVHGVSAGDTGTAGAVPVNMVAWMHYDGRPMPAKDLLAWDGNEQAHRGRGHLWSWLLYHWLWNQRSKAFADYQKRLADSGDPEGSWRAAFPDLDPDKPEAMDKLDAELERYRVQGRFTFFRTQVADVGGAYTRGQVTSSDLHLYLLGMRRNWPPEKERRQALRQAILDEALNEDPGSPWALASQATAKGPLGADALRAAVRARPADARGWLLMAGSAPAAEKEAALRKAVELNPENAQAQNDLAWLLVDSNRPQDALPFANRALDLAPWDANIVDTLAEVALRLGRCADALALEKRAVTSAPGGALQKRQAAMEQRCKH